MKTAANRRTEGYAFSMLLPLCFNVTVAIMSAGEKGCDCVVIYMAGIDVGAFLIESSSFDSIPEIKLYLHDSLPDNGR
jgi:hypothetical protein